MAENKALESIGQGFACSLDEEGAHFENEGHHAVKLINHIIYEVYKQSSVRIRERRVGRNNDYAIVAPKLSQLPTILQSSFLACSVRFALLALAWLHFKETVTIACAMQLENARCYIRKARISYSARTSDHRILAQGSSNQQNKINKV